MVLNSKPRFSVIIPTYNHAHLIKRCLGSVIAQTVVDWEAIVVNNYSEDNTVDVVQSFNDKRIKLVNFRNNGVVAASRNEGLRCAKGDYVAFLDSDDWWYPNKLSVVSKHLDRADVIYHDLDIFTTKGKKLFRKMRGRRLKRPAFVDLLTKGNALVNSSVVAKKSLIDQVDGLSEDKNLVAHEDYDLWIRLAMITERFLHLDKKLGGYWIGGSNLWSVALKQTVGMETICERHMKHLEDVDRREAELFKSYQIGRVKQRLGFYDEAVNNFHKVLRSRNPVFRIKALILIAFIRLFH